jgi:hypothetical protein
LRTTWTERPERLWRATCLTISLIICGRVVSSPDTIGCKSERAVSQWRDAARSFFCRYCRLRFLGAEYSERADNAEV